MTRTDALPRRDPELPLTDQQAQRAFEEGLTWEMKGNLKAALASFKEAVLLAPGEPRPLIAVGHTYESMGKMAQAAEWYLRAEEVGAVGDAPTAPPPAPTQEHSEHHVWITRLNPNGLPDDEVSSTVGDLKTLLVRYGPDPLALRKLALLVARSGDIKRASGYILEADWAKQRGTSWH